MNAVEAQAEDTTKRVNKMDEKFCEFKQELLDKFEFFMQQAQMQANQQVMACASSVQTPTAFQKPNTKKPIERASISCHDRSKDLLDEAEAKRHHFFFGPVKEGNKMVNLTVSSSEVIRCYLSTVSLANNGPIDADHHR